MSRGKAKRLYRTRCGRIAGELWQRGKCNGEFIDDYYARIMFLGDDGNPVKNPRFSRDDLRWLKKVNTDLRVELRIRCKKVNAKIISKLIRKTAEKV